MKLLKYFLFSLLGVFAIILIISSFIPANKIIRRSVLINKPNYFVFQKVADFKNWMKWNNWSEMELSASNIISGESKGVGSIWTWHGKQASGIVSIDSMISDSLIITDISVKKTFRIKAMGKWTFKPDSTSTLTVWENESLLDYPVGRFLGIFMEKELGRDMQVSLDNLKKLCETR